MPRKRYIKPSFNDDDDVVVLSDSARLLYALLWGHMDRNGVIEDSVHSIRSKVYPREERAIELISQHLGELLKPGPSGRPRLYRFTWRGKSYLHAPTMPRHQKIYSDEPAIIPISPHELATVADEFEMAMKLKDAPPQLGTVPGAGQVHSPGVDGERLSTGGEPEQLRASASASASYLSSASASARPVQIGIGDKSPKRSENLGQAGRGNDGGQSIEVIDGLINGGAHRAALELIQKLPPREQTRYVDFIGEHAGLGRSPPWEGTA